MARNDKRNEDAATARVTKASEVHKRRVGRKSPARSNRHAPSEAQATREGAASEEAAPTAAPQREDVHGDLFANDPASGSGESRAYGEGPEEALETDGAREAQDAADALEQDGGFASDDALDGEELFADEGAPIADEGYADEGERDEAEGALTAPKPKRSAKRLVKRIVLTLLALVVLAAVVCAGLFSWDRWGRYDDHADMQGDWYVDGTAALVAIDEESIRLSDEVAYAYRIDDREKTIEFSFADWEGQGRYRFSEDRQLLIIEDGEFDGVTNTAEGVAQEVSEIYQSATGTQPPEPGGEGVIVLNRAPDPAAMAAKLAAEREAAEQQRLLEEQGEDYEGEYYEDESYE